MSRSKLLVRSQQLLHFLQNYPWLGHIDRDIASHLVILLRIIFNTNSSYLVFLINRRSKFFIHHEIVIGRKLSNSNKLHSNVIASMPDVYRGYNYHDCSNAVVEIKKISHYTHFSVIIHFNSNHS